MDIPSVKRLIAKYHEANVSLRRKAVEADQKANEKVFREKGKGQWELYRQLKKEPANPLVAVRRVRRGRRGQSAGTVATSPEEIDEILREVYGEMYRGNGGEGDDPVVFAEKYMEEYKKYIFKQKEMSMMEMRGEDIEVAIRAG